MKYDCESRDYVKNMLAWLLSLETYDAANHKVGEVYYSITTNLFPIPDLTVTITKINDKRAVIIQLPEAKGLIKELNLSHLPVIYIPEEVEVSFHDYDKFGKRMFSARVDKIFWIYEERFQGRPAANGGILANFGMDMTMPFLEQQNFEYLD